jgi:hypothetical protein
LLLARHPGMVFSKEQIYDSVWHEFYSGDYNIVMSHIHNLREKIEDNPNENGEIKTTKMLRTEEHGVGIKNIIEVIEKYNGSYVIKNDDEEFYFSIVIPA